MLGLLGYTNIDKRDKIYFVFILNNINKNETL